MDNLLDTEEFKNQEKNIARAVGNANLVMPERNIEQIIMTRIKERKSRENIFKAKWLSIFFFLIEVISGVYIYLIWIKPVDSVFFDSISARLLFQIIFIGFFTLQAQFLSTLFRSKKYWYSS